MKTKTLLLLAGLMAQSALLWASDTTTAVQTAPITGVTATASAPSTGAQLAPLTPDKDCWALFGWMIGSESGLQDLKLTSEELTIVCANFTLGAQGKPAPVAYNESVTTQMGELINKRYKEHQEEVAKMNQITAKANNEAEVAYFAKLDQDTKIQKTASGLRYQITNAGSDAVKAGPTDLVTVLYTGKLINGAVFDSTSNRGNEPAVFPIAGVIPGVAEGLQLVGEGGKITLYIPAALGYGDSALPGIPAGSTLVFDFEVIKVTREPAPAKS